MNDVNAFQCWGVSGSTFQFTGERLISTDVKNRSNEVIKASLGSTCPESVTLVSIAGSN
jgi:hypothetical protein